MFFPHVHYFAVTDTEICLPLSPCCVIPLQLCGTSLTSAFPHSWVWLLWITLHPLWPLSLHLPPLLLSRSLTDMLFNAGLSNPHWILLRNSLHCELGPYLCPLCCIFSLGTNSEECIPTHILTTHILNNLWQGACSKPFENLNMYTSKILSLCLHTNVSFLWFELNISHLMWVVEGFLCAYIGFKGSYSYKC